MYYVDLVWILILTNFKKMFLRQFRKQNTNWILNNIKESLTLWGMIVVLWLHVHMHVCTEHPYQLEIITEIFVGKKIGRSGICFKMFKLKRREGCRNWFENGKKIITCWNWIQERESTLTVLISIFKKILELDEKWNHLSPLLTLGCH